MLGISADQPETDHLIKSLYKFLFDQLDGKELVGFMYQQDIISEDDMETIQTIPTRKRRMKLLMEKVLLGPPRIFSGFVQAVKEANFPHVSKKIEDIQKQTEKSCEENTLSGRNTSVQEMLKHILLEEMDPIDRDLAGVFEVCQSTFIKTKVFDCVEKILKESNCVSICGPPGQGKTTLALMISCRFHQRGYYTKLIKDCEDFKLDKCVSSHRPTALVFDDIFGTHSFSTYDATKVFGILDKINNYWTLQKTRENSILAKQKTAVTSMTSFTTKDEKIKCTSTQESYAKCDPTLIMETLSEIPHIPDLKIIFTSRSYMFSEAMSQMERYKLTFFKHDTIVDLSEDVPLEKSEMKAILQSHLRTSGLGCRQDFVDEISFETMNKHGFPHSCKLFASFPVFQSNPADFFQKPLASLVHNTEQIIYAKREKAAALLLLIMCDGKIDLQCLHDVHLRLSSGIENHLEILKTYINFRPENLATDISKAIRDMTGTYFIAEGTHVSTAHDSVYDAAAYIIGKTYPEFVLRYCSLQFVHERITVEPDSKHEGHFMVTLKPMDYMELVQRLAREISEMRFHLSLTHNALENTKLLDQLIGEMEKCENCGKIFHGSDMVYGYHFLFSLSFVAKDVFLKRVLKRTIYTPHEKIHGLYGCCISGNTEAFDILIKDWDTSLIDTIPDLTKSFSSSMSKTCIPQMDDENMLHTSCKHGQTDIVLKLLNHGANINHQNAKFCTPLLTAINERIQTAKALISHGANITIQNKENQTALHRAVLKGQEELVSVLIQHGIDVNTVDQNSNNSLHLACGEGYTNIARQLLACDMDVNGKGQQNASAIFWAAQSGNAELLMELITSGANLKFLDRDGDSALIWACEKGQKETAVKLLDLGLDVNQKGFDQQTPVINAAMSGNADLLQILIERGADYNLVDTQGHNALNWACLKGQKETAVKLLDLGLDVNQRGFDQQTPVINAAMSGNTDLLQILVERGADYNLLDMEGQSALCWACHQGQRETAVKLLDLGADVNQRGHLRQTPVIHAAISGNTNLLQILIERGADYNLLDEDGDSAFNWACEMGQKETAVKLLDLGLDVNQRGFNQQTPVINAAISGNTDLLQILIERGADYNLLDECDDSAFHWACRVGQKETAVKLLDLGFDVTQRGSLSRTPVIYAAMSGNADLLQILIERGADYNSVDEDGDSALNWACRQGHKEAALKLLDLGLDVNHSGYLRQTPRMNATVSGNRDLVQILIDRGGL